MSGYNRLLVAISNGRDSPHRRDVMPLMYLLVASRGCKMQMLHAFLVKEAT